MKPLFTAGLCACLLLLFSAAGAQKLVKEKADAKKTRVGTGRSMKGAYEMTLLKASVDNRDSIIDRQQLKIYTDRHFMYAHALPGDSLGDFGIGTYRMQNGSLTEYVFYTGSGGAQSDTFQLAIDQRADGYSQVINLPAEQGERYVLTENYRDAGKNVSSPLDGAWKMTALTEYSANGTPAERSTPVQYKVYQSGNVLWANISRDSATQKPVSAFGYGTFEMKGPNRAIEVMTNSTYRTALVGVPVTLQLEFVGKDRYRQTIVWTDGSKTMEVYERLK